MRLPTHPNIVQVYGVCKTLDENLVLVMEYLVSFNNNFVFFSQVKSLFFRIKQEHGNLLEALRRNSMDALNYNKKKFTLTELLLFAQDVCKGMVGLFIFLKKL